MEVCSWWFDGGIGIADAKFSENEISALVQEDPYI